ncbi:MAG: membrane integrity-associated transporter subunit PqiC [Rhodospirillales bacterium]|nr:membrane integrity-associated transporter subunit PqiC [Rhodospirillales bacterium]
MMPTRRQLSWGLLALAALPAACASPNPVLYTLDPVPGPVRPGGPKTVLLRDIAIAPYLDRKMIVRSSAGFRIAVEQNDWWGEPFAGMLSRVLAAELEQRLPGTTVLTAAGTIDAPADARISINIARFDQAADGAVILAAQSDIGFTSKTRPGVVATQRLSATPAGSGVAAQVAAMSVALGALADRLAQTLAAH